MKDVQHREWIIPCNSKYYDLPSSLSNLKIIDWEQKTQMNKALVGDTVYIYYKERNAIGTIRYKGVILEVNKQINIIDDSRFTTSNSAPIGTCFTLAVYRDFSLDGELTYAKLKEAGLKSRLMGPTVIKGTVSEYLSKCDKKQERLDKQSGRKPDTCLSDTPEGVIEAFKKGVSVAKEVNASDKPNYWIYAPGEQANMQPTFVEKGIIAVDWWGAHLGDLKRFESREQIAMYMQLMYGTDHSFQNDSLCLYQFCNEMKVGDIVFCKGGHYKLTGICRITSEYYHSDTEELGRFSKKYNCIVDTYKHRRNVEWLDTTERTTDKKLPLKTLTKITDEKTYSHYLDLYMLPPPTSSSEPLDDSHSEEEKEAHARSLPTDALEKAALAQTRKKPKVTVSPVKQIERSQYIAEYARRRANGICQLCGQKAPFNRADGTPYLESHHIDWLSEGGEDSIDNTVALCPNCHKKMHIVKDENDVKRLKTVNASLKKNNS